MDDDSVQAVFEAVSREIELYPRRGRLEEYFEGLVATAREALRALPVHPEEDELRVVTAMSWLGPRGSAPPVGLHGHLLNDVLRKNIADTAERSDRALEFTLAHGCGLWPAPEGAGTWFTTPWPNANRLLRQKIQGWIREVRDWLAPHATMVSTDARADAQILALRLLHPMTTVAHDPENPPRIFRAREVTEVQMPSRPSTHLGDGAKSVFRVPGPVVVKSFEKAEMPRLEETYERERRDWADGTRVVVTSRPSATWIEAPEVPDAPRLELGAWQWADVEAPQGLEVFECSCGTKGCPTKHRLLEDRLLERGPSPAKKITLWSLLASAVKGPQSEARYGSIVAGMYYPLLVHGTPDFPPVHGGRVEFKFCGKCGTRFQGDGCNTCGAGFDGATMLRVARDWIIPTDSPAYEERPRLRCVNKAEHYRKLTDKEPRGELTDTWENFYEVPAEFSALLEARKAGDAARVKALRDIVFVKTTCPICKGPPKSQESHLWVWTGRQVVEWAQEEDNDD